MVKIYDVSLLINEDIIIYPGNEPVLIKQYAFRENAHVNESKIKYELLRIYRKRKQPGS